jgi:hypothetical protein
MPHQAADWRKALRRAGLTIIAVALPLALIAVPMVHAQAIMVHPSLAPHIDPGIAGHAPPPVIHTPQPSLTGRLAVQPHLPSLHTSPNLSTACGGASRSNGDDCPNVTVTTNSNSLKHSKGKAGGPRRDTIVVQPLTAFNLRSINDEVVAEIEGTEAQADEMARRHGLRRIGSQNFPLINATIGLFRITDRRPFEVVSREFATEAGVRYVQPNYRYILQEQKTALSENDSVQYALAKLRLPDAHMLAHGANIRVAVVDSGIDIRHPELANSILESFDALGSNEGPHVHGTGIAGAIAAHAKLTGSAPAAQLLAIRAFGAGANGAQSNSYVILKALDYAVSHSARIINMSFAGPKDALIERGIAAVAAHNIVMVAAAGNAGAKSPPLYPAANPNVIAVSATDAHDHLFPASNRGNYVAVAAPGVDVFLPAPDDKYQITSGTSFSAAYVSGLIALMLERNPALQPEELRTILMRTARDLGSPGRDDLFGAGEADAYGAVQAAIATPVATTSAPPHESLPENSSERREMPPVRTLSAPVSTMASEKGTTGDGSPPAAR